MTTAALHRTKGIEALIRDLHIADSTQSSVGTWDSPEGEKRVSIFHETGHVYAVPYEFGESGPELLFRLPVERIGVDAAIQAVEQYFESAGQPKMRECDMMNCRNPVPEDAGKSIAPGTYLAVCDECAPIVAMVR